MLRPQNYYITFRGDATVNIKSILYSHIKILLI